jgi:trans-aconitate methyltransferase
VGEVPQLERDVAAPWVERWEVQQGRYAGDRDARTAALLTLVEHALTGVAAPVVVEIGCGPGALTAALHDRIPKASVTGVDADPFLLALARATVPAPVRFVHTVVGGDGWIERLGLARSPDAIVSSTTLHYLPEVELRRLYGQLADLLGPGALLLDADHLHLASPALRDLTDALDTTATDAAREDWAGWWRAVAQDPDLGPVLARSSEHGPAVTGDHDVSTDRHVQLLVEAGFSAAGTVWRHGPSAVLAALR